MVTQAVIASEQGGMPCEKTGSPKDRRSLGWQLSEALWPACPCRSLPYYFFSGGCSIRKILTGARGGLALKSDINISAKVKRKPPVERAAHIAADIGEHHVGRICEGGKISYLERNRAC